MAHNRALLVPLTRRLKAGRGNDDEAVLVGGVEQLLALVVGQAELCKLGFGEDVATDIHPNDAGVQLGTHRIKDGRKRDVRQVVAVVGRQVEAVSRPVDFVHHGQHALLVDIVVIVTGEVWVGDIHAVGLTIGDEHEGRDLNVLRLHPLLHELRGNGSSLNRGRTVERQATGCADVVGFRNQRLVDVGKQTLTLGRIVPRGGEVHQAAQAVLHRARLGVDCRGVSELAVKVSTALLGLPNLTLILVPSDQGGGVDIGEAEHLKRDLHLFAEPHQLKHLKERVTHPHPHAAGEVKQEHDAVVLALLLHDLADEQVIVGAVLMEAVKVQHPGLLGALTADLVRSLAAVELRGQLTDEGIGVLDELAVVVHVEAVVAIVLLKLREQEVGREDRLVHVHDRGDGDDGGGVHLPVLLADALHEVGHAVPGDLLALTGLRVPANLLALHLLTNALHGRVVVQTLGDIVDLRESLNGVDHVHELLLVRAERHIKEALHTPLEV